MGSFHSTIGKKVIVALTGVVLVGFLIGHLMGNLLVFVGPSAFNYYAASIKGMPLLLWGTRTVLLFSVFLHVLCTVQLTRRNKASRPVSYAQFKPQQATCASLFMIWSGLFLGAYIVYHLLHFTLGAVHPRFSSTDVYSNVVIGFSVWYVSLIYILAMISLGFHLFHGVWSVFQTLGLNHEKYNKARRYFSVGSSLIISLGFISIPVAVLLGIVH